MHSKYLTLLLGSLFIVLVGCNKAFTGYTTSGERPVLLNDDTYQLYGIAADPQYGYTAQSPIHVGGYEANQGDSHIRRYLNALRDPQGNPVQWTYNGPCCAYKSTRDRFGQAQLEIYAIEYPGQALSPLLLYFDNYNYDRLLAPQGLDFVRQAN